MFSCIVFCIIIKLCLFLKYFEHSEQLITNLQNSIDTKFSSNFEEFSLNRTWSLSNSKKSIKIEASVPGTVYSDLVRANILSDPYFAFKDVEFRWVANDDWQYSISFKLPKSLLDMEEIYLVCEGLDTVSTISLNRVKIKETSNMFVKYILPIKNFLSKDSNSLEINFRSPIQFTLEQNAKLESPIFPNQVPQAQNGESHVNLIRKEQSSFSWDWGPAFPDMGIWKNIKVVGYKDVLVEDFTISAMKNSNTETWKVSGKIYFYPFNSKNGGSTVVKFRFNFFDLSFVKKIMCELNTKNSPCKYEFPIESKITIEKWYPSGYGSQRLYNVLLSYKTENHVTGFPSLHKKIGFRTVELVTDDLGPGIGNKFVFVVNGEEVYAKGSNWIPADSFTTRVTRDKIYDLLLSAKISNMNMLRIWGGGIYESDYFYSLADELGIMIWQDSMFASALYPSDPDFIQSVKEETINQVKRLQHHPSVVIWCGNNEDSSVLQSRLNNQTYDAYKKLSQAIYSGVKDVDAQLPFVFSSPSTAKETYSQPFFRDAQNKDSGDIHFYQYYQNPWYGKIYPEARFVSEFGYQSWPSYDSLSHFASSEDLVMNSKFFHDRNHQAFGNQNILNIIGQLFKFPLNKNPHIHFFNFIYLSQISQAVAIKTEVEEYRKQYNLLPNGKGYNRGALYWQLNSVWPAPSWSSIEWSGGWKLLQYYAKDFFAPTILTMSTNNHTMQFHLISDVKLSSPKPIFLEILAFRTNSFGAVFEKEVLLSMEKDFIGSKVVYEMKKSEMKDYEDSAPHISHFVIANLLHKSEEGGSAQYDISPYNYFLFDVPKNMLLYDPNLEVSEVIENSEDFTIIVHASAPAFFVKLYLKNVEGRFSENGFIMYREFKNVSFYPKKSKSIGKGDIVTNLRILSLFNTN